MFFLKDEGFEYSKTQLKTEVIDINNLEDGFTQLQLRFTFDFNSGAFSHEVTWSNHDIELIVSQLENLRLSGEITAIEPEISFSYQKMEKNLYTFYIHFDNGMIHSNMGTDSGISLRLIVNRQSLVKWARQLTKLLHHT
ncbi:hypothetical protein CHH57_18935 [Niallia circulans]|uniref:Uncharacterized protein n=1 Tax=Niallia circulans TaxID=1397 RepID=A0AA91TP86_NIACI|nr:hypothetical protein [Niallia circulans]PAD81619.1 hypothetical protein CHH57_18935 [Niallia circulans]